MAMPRDAFQSNIEESIVESWRTFIGSMKESMDMLEKEMDDAAEMNRTCTSEWCEATEHVLDELGNSLFSINEPRWASDEDSRRIREMKKRLHDLYAKYKSTAQ